MFLYLLTRDLKRGKVRISHVYFFHEGDIFKYHYCFRRLVLYFKCFYYSIFDNCLLHLRFHCDVSIPVLSLHSLNVSAAGNLVILGNCCNCIMSQLYNIRHLKTCISSGDVSFHRCPDQLYRIEVCMVSREPEAVMSILF